jgi:hypothetical protein
MENTEHTPSQVIEAPGPTTENPSITPEPPKEEPKPAKMSAQDAISKAFDQAGVEDKEGDEPAPKVENPVEAKEVKPAKVEKSAEPEKADVGNEREAPRKVEGQSEGRKIIEAPARFLPRAKELWQNVPHPVREEFDRVFRESEQEMAQYKEHKQFREELSEFETMAKQSGTTMKQALSNYVDIEKKFSQDPAQGFRSLMGNLQMQPQQAISHILRAYGVTPQQLVQHMTQSPQEYTALAQPRQAPQQQFQQPQVPQDNPQVKALEERLARMEAERVENDVITPFAEEYPEFHQNQDAIAEVLKSGIIERIHGNGLSPRDKLEAALFMVAPHVKRSLNVADNGNTSVPSIPRDIPPAVDLRGTKSIKGAPHGVQTDRRGKMSKEDAINEAMARFGS